MGLIVALVLMGALGVGGYALLQSRLDQGAGQPVSKVYDDSELRRTDSSLVLYRQARSIAVPLVRARAVAVGPDDRIYVAGDRAIEILPPASARPARQPATASRRAGMPGGDAGASPEAASSRPAASGPGTSRPSGASRPATGVGRINLADAPRCLTVDKDGTLFVGMKEHVEVFDASGRALDKWESLGQAELTSLAAIGDGIFAADAHSRLVVRYDRAGRLLGRFGRKGEGGAPGFVVPSPHFDLAAAPDGLLRVANPGRHQVETWTPDGQYRSAWGRFADSVEGFGSCCNPCNIAILPDGQSVTCEKGISRVKVYGPAGEFVGVVAGPEAFDRDRIGGGGPAEEGVLDVAVDSAGRVLVLDPKAGEVRVFVRKVSP